MDILNVVVVYGLYIIIYNIIMPRPLQTKCISSHQPHIQADTPTKMDIIYRCQFTAF